MTRFYPTDWRQYAACPRCGVTAGSRCRDTRFRFRVRELTHVHEDRPLTRPTTREEQ